MIMVWPLPAMPAPALRETGRRTRPRLHIIGVTKLLLCTVLLLLVGVVYFALYLYANSADSTITFAVLMPHFHSRDRYSAVNGRHPSADGGVQPAPAAAVSMQPRGPRPTGLSLRSAPQPAANDVRSPLSISLPVGTMGSASFDSNTQSSMPSSVDRQPLSSTTSTLVSAQAPPSPSARNMSMMIRHLAPPSLRIAETFTHQAMWKAFRDMFDASDVETMRLDANVGLRPLPLNLSITMLDNRLALLPAEDIVLCLAASEDRFALLAKTIPAWDGPVVVGIFCSTQTCVDRVGSLGWLTTVRPNTAVLLVVSAVTNIFYPVNAMRNIMMDYVPPGRGHATFVIDSDFILSRNAYATLRRMYAANRAPGPRMGARRRRALVVPCFEFGANSYDVNSVTEAHSSLIPRTKEELLKLPREMVRPSKNLTFPGGHSPVIIVTRTVSCTPRQQSRLHIMTTHFAMNHDCWSHLPDRHKCTLY
eukprot:Opistho-2@41766